MTTDDNGLPPQERDRIVARHVAAGRPLWREPAFWAGGVFTLTALLLIILWVQDNIATANRHARDNAAGLAKANQQLSSLGHPPVAPAPVVPTVTMTITVPVVGPEGPAGEQGPPGPAGARGGIGPSGRQGDPGLPGANGPQGAPGATGSAGAAGPTGAAGPSGPAGPAGPSGPSGPAGPTCPDGYTATPQNQPGGGSIIVCTSPPNNPGQGPMP